MLDAHAASVLALLEAVPNLTVYPDGAPDKADPPYVAVYFSVDTERSDRLTAKTTESRLRATTHSVGRNAAAARRVSDKVRAALLDVSPAVAGWVAWPIRRESGIPAAPDESTGHKVFDVIDAWTWRATPGGS